MTEPGLVKTDPWLKPFEKIIGKRYQKYLHKLSELVPPGSSLRSFADSFQYYGLHFHENRWVFREWAPNAVSLFLIGDFSGWKPMPEFALQPIGQGNWEIYLPAEVLKHQDLYKIHVCWEGGEGIRIPSHATRVVQDETTLLFSAQVWCPVQPFVWTDASFATRPSSPMIYEAHIGMSSEEYHVSTYDEFRRNVLPRIHRGGYNTIQLMAIQEHPYYGSFGYHVSNFFAPSSRFGEPEDLKRLVNEAHELGINVIMDLVHSHAVKNVNEGLGLLDGTSYQYFHDGPRGDHPAWDSKCFNYSKNEVIRFLLSNCRYWLEEYHFDGYRFDGVTSMLYYNHGLEVNFTCYDDYFRNQEDEDAIVYLMMANQVIHEINPMAISIAEEMSGYPGLAGKISDAGMGFDFRLSMGVPDFWIKMVKEIEDENWNMGKIFHELTQHRIEERTINYAESHDQALVGDKTLIFRLVDKEMYFHMSKMHQNLIIDRGMALHKMIRLVTLATCNGGYLNFMGNEFGHPEWIDFPREGNNWSYQHARRQWSLADNPDLKYHFLGDFDREMVHLLGPLLQKGLPSPFLIAANDGDKVLVFARGEWVFVFNFHPQNSYTGYGVSVEAGKYQLMLNTDNPMFGGFDRIDESWMYYSQPLSKQSDAHQILIYAPSRVALVFKKLPTPRVH